MASWCNFRVDVTGPQAARDELACLLEQEVNPQTVGVADAQPVVQFDENLWGEMEGDPQVWLDTLPDPGSVGCIGRDEQAVVFSGTAAWTPPLGWLQRASAKFPGLSFVSTSTTESEWYEEWTARGGEVSRREERLIDIPSDSVVGWERGGKVLIDRKHGVPLPLELFDPVTELGEGDMRRLLAERLVLLEQHYQASRYRPKAACVMELEGRLDENDREHDEVVARTRAERSEPADDRERQECMARSLDHLRSQRAARRARLSERPQPPAETGRE